MQGIRESLRRLKQGEMLMVFPEGSRSPDGDIASFEPGIGILARHGKAAILPAAIEGAFNAWPRTRHCPRLRAGRIEVHFGPILSPEETRKCDEAELVLEVRKRVQACQAILRERRRKSEYRR